MNQPLDIFDSADNPQAVGTNGSYWGQVTITLRYVVLEKGTGKVDFDPNTHSQDRRRTAVDLILTPLSEMALQFVPERNMIAEFPEWMKHVLPSIKALGISVRDLNGHFVKAHMKPTGESYTDRNGETKEKTTIVIDKIFASEAECLMDYLAEKNGAPQMTASQMPPAAQTTANPERETALKFLRVIVTNVCQTEHDLEKINAEVATKIQGYPIVAKHFTVQSPETLDLIMQSSMPS